MDQPRLPTRGGVDTLLLEYLSQPTGGLKGLSNERNTVHL